MRTACTALALVVALLIANPAFAAERRGRPAKMRHSLLPND